MLKQVVQNNEKLISCAWFWLKFCKLDVAMLVLPWHSEAQLGCRV